MPSLNYCTATNSYFENADDKHLFNKGRKNMWSKISYWKKHYGYDIKNCEYQMFSENVKIIREVYMIRHFIKNIYEPNKLFSTVQHQEIYAANYKNLKKIDHILYFLKRLDTL